MSWLRFALLGFIILLMSECSIEQKTRQVTFEVTGSGLNVQNGIQIGMVGFRYANIVQPPIQHAIPFSATEIIAVGEKVSLTAGTYPSSTGTIEEAILIDGAVCFKISITAIDLPIYSTISMVID